jgi:DNA-binding IclR family transcriptional regulator
MTGEPGYRAVALERGLAILQDLASAGRPLTIAQAHARTGLPKSTLIRLLSVLQDDGYVTRVDEQPSYWLGPAVMRLADAYTDALDVSAYAMATLRALAEAAGQTANLGVIDGPEVVHLCVVEPDRALRFRAATGTRDGAYHTGLGKLLLAHVPPDELDAHLPEEPFPARTEATITRKADLRRQLATIRREGFAADIGEGDPGVGCLAVPLHVGDSVIAAVSVTGPVAEITGPSRKDLLTLLRTASDELAAEPQFSYALALARRSLA